MMTLWSQWGNSCSQLWTKEKRTFSVLHSICSRRFRTRNWRCAILIASNKFHTNLTRSRMSKETWTPSSTWLTIHAHLSSVCSLTLKFIMNPSLWVSTSSILMTNLMRTQLTLTGTSRSRIAWKKPITKWLSFMIRSWLWNWRFSMKSATLKRMVSRRDPNSIALSSHTKTQTSKSYTRVTSTLTP